jgi:hypothetical protein
MEGEIIKRTVLVSLLLTVVLSFSGCLGLGSGSTTTSEYRNDSQGVFKSTDGGKTWQQKVAIEGDAERRLDQISTGSIAIDPVNTQVLYLGTLGHGMFKTENGADTWYEVADANNKFRDNSYIYDIQVEKGNSNVVYAATLNDNRGVLLKTEDGGKSWTESYISTEAGKAIKRVQIDPQQPNVVYVGTAQGGFLRSEDRGQSWSMVRWFEYGVKDFAVDYADSRNIMVLTSNGLAKTADGGADEETSWQSLTKTLQDFLDIRKAKINQITSIVIDNQDPSVFYLTYENLVFVTRDGGLSWDTLDTITPTTSDNENLPEIKKIGLMDGTIYYGAGNAFYKSVNKGLSWSSFDIPILGDVKYTVSDPNDQNVIYVGALYKKE